ncbi:Trp biosynthesis-associated membrane protein [Nigerium massiliense]|uniref:Trp biosynthesis-associated membrane protein n=1 Tax=Nigerium massiliense TaxID=1522317 RepID=UPI000694C5D1|nr:Trp biosynthesis-associated membrane protein [Nigerium massiliense]
MKLGPVPALWTTGALAFVVALQPWWRIAADGGAVTASLTGTAATGGLAQALALVCLGGILVTLTLRSTGRRVIGVLLALTYAGVAVLGAVHPRPSAGAIEEALRTMTFAPAQSVTETAWPWAYAVIGVAGVAASLWLLRRPGRPDRPRGVRDEGEPLDDSLASWKAMDAGVDPTADAPSREDQR